MLKLSKCLKSSTARSLLCSEEGEKFLTVITSKLNMAKVGEIQIDSNLVRYWERIQSQANVVSSRRKEIDQLKTLIKEDSELKSLAEEEKNMLEDALDENLIELGNAVVPKTEMDVLRKCQIELTSGAGGQEAMLFTGELLEMYRKYAEWKGWKWEPIQLEDVALGGIRCALIGVTGENAYSKLRFEAGVHRVQRIPLTDKSRMHTSTASVAILPEPEEVSVVVPSDSVKIETMRASGPGGQNVNKRSTAVRMTHKDTGIAVHCMDERFQHLNIQIAYKRLAAILLQRQVDEQSDRFSSDRKLQVGSKARAEKIRTYNFQHDRITDHRIQMQLGNIEEFMKGTEALDNMMNRLNDEHMIDRLRHILFNCITE
ncbi:unnamed protein product [Auanema sp. JU1783]|nr:unnamed protein product [Auanema sp. JU1783]